MLCSISKPSKSSWLDRLRSSKGFPISSDGLEHFLTSAPNPNPNPNPNPTDDAPLPEITDQPPPNPSAAPRRSSNHSAADPKIEDEKDRLFDLMSNVLAELFIIGDPRSPPASGTLTLGERRNSRKQPNPKIRAPSASASADGSFSPRLGQDFRAPAMSARSTGDSITEARKSRTKPRRKSTSIDPLDSDLSAYSSTEVTVIDTSSSIWKTEKLIFRKGTVWKVRDKKMWNACRKKRKMGPGERSSGEKDKGKPPVDSKAQSRKEPLASNEGCTDANKIDASEEIGDQMHIPLRRAKFSRSPRLVVAKDSSHFRLQVISTSRKNAGCLLRGYPETEKL